MPLVPLVVALQLQTASLAGVPTARPEVPVADSARDARRARDAQANFERTRRSNLPWEGSSGGRCEVRLGRYCWWFDEAPPSLPPESDVIARRRAELVALFDTLAERHPGDDWLAGMRVHYRVDGRHPEAADSAARACHPARWWCDALMGYAAHVHGDAALADSAFARALAGMDEATRCRWTDIHTLLPSDTRERYEEMDCASRAAIERRYWLLGRPELAAPANEWRNEFYTRRVQAWLAERSRTPHNMSWGNDSEELLLRYGWPTAWARAQQGASSFSATEPSVIGHDPTPSFAFSPREELLDSSATGGDDAWNLESRFGEARFAPRHVRRVVGMSAQVARFRRGDSVLVVTAYAATSDSLAKPSSHLAATLNDQQTAVSAPDSLRIGTASLLVATPPQMVGVEVADTVTGTLARKRVVFRPDRAAARLTLSDLLLYRPGPEPAPVLDSALARAIPGDTVSRDRPVGLFWETYGVAEGGETLDVAVTVERIDRSWFRSARQAFGLADQDTPLRIRWTDARSAASGIAPHAVSLDLGNLPGGRYRLTLTLTPEGAPAVISTGEIELRQP